MYRSATVRRLLATQERTITRLERQNDDLIDRVMFLSGKTWAPSPASITDLPVADHDEPAYIDVDEIPV